MSDCFHWPELHSVSVVSSSRLLNVWTKPFLTQTCAEQIELVMAEARHGMWEAERAKEQDKERGEIPAEGMNGSRKFDVQQQIVFSSLA